MVSKNWKLRCGVCHEWSNGCKVFKEIPLIGGFVEKQHEIKSTAWSGKTTECLVSPSDCDKTAKIMTDKGSL
jgi:hypothetical protein